MGHWQLPSLFQSVTNHSVYFWRPWAALPNSTFHSHNLGAVVL